MGKIRPERQYVLSTTLSPFDVLQTQRKKRTTKWQQSSHSASASQQPLFLYAAFPISQSLIATDTTLRASLLFDPVVKLVL